MNQHRTSGELEQQARKEQGKLREDLLLVAQIFNACITTRSFPAIGSPCHKQVKRVIKAASNG